MSFTSRVGRYVNVDLLTVQWLTGFNANVRVVTTLPATIPDDGVVWVKSVGGFSDWDEARIRVDVQVLIPGVDGDADPIAQQVHERMGQLGGNRVGDQRVNLVRCMSPFTRHPWAEDIDRVLATYELVLPVL
jgi:hypothetical protein